MNTTPALELAALLGSLSAHLRANPHLSAVNIARNGGQGHSLQIAASSHRGEPGGAQALHSWASSLDDVEIIASKWKHRDALIKVRGATNDGHRLSIWDVVDGAASTLGLTRRDLPKYAELPITIEQLRTLSTREETATAQPRTWRKGDSEPPRHLVLEDGAGDRLAHLGKGWTWVRLEGRDQSEASLFGFVWRDVQWDHDVVGGVLTEVTTRFGEAGPR